jgi:hypothetical protein
MRTWFIPATLILIASTLQASAQSAQYCAGICGGTNGSQVMTPNAGLEACYRRCIDGKPTPAAEATDKGARRGKKTQ